MSCLCISLKKNICCCVPRYYVYVLVCCFDRECVPQETQSSNESVRSEYQRACLQCFSLGTKNTGDDERCRVKIFWELKFRDEINRGQKFGDKMSCHSELIVRDRHRTDHTHISREYTATHCTIKTILGISYCFIYVR